MKAMFITSKVFVKALSEQFREAAILIEELDRVIFSSRKEAKEVISKITGCITSIEPQGENDYLLILHSDRLEFGSDIAGRLFNIQGYYKAI